MHGYDGYARIEYEVDYSPKSVELVRKRLQWLHEQLVLDPSQYGRAYWFLIGEIKDMLNMQLKRVD